MFSRGDIILGRNLSWNNISFIGCGKLKNDFSLFSFSFYHERVNGPGAIFLYSEGAFQKVIVSIYHGTECIQFAAPAGQIKDTYLT